MWPALTGCGCRKCNNPKPLGSTPASSALSGCLPASWRLHQLAAQREGVPPGRPCLGRQAPVLPNVRRQHLLADAGGGGQHLSHRGWCLESTLTDARIRQLISRAQGSLRATADANERHSGTVPYVGRHRGRLRCSRTFAGPCTPGDPDSDPGGKSVEDLTSHGGDAPRAPHRPAAARAASCRQRTPASRPAHNAAKPQTRPWGAIGTDK